MFSIQRKHFNLGSFKSQSTLKNDESSLVRSPSPIKRTPSPIEKKIIGKSSSRQKLRAGSPPFETRYSDSKEKCPSPTSQGAIPKMTASSSYNIFRRNSSSTKMMDQEQKQKSSSLSKKKFGFLFMGHSLNQ